MGILWPTGGRTPVFVTVPIVDQPHSDQKALQFIPWLAPGPAHVDCIYDALTLTMSPFDSSSTRSDAVALTVVFLVQQVADKHSLNRCMSNLLGSVNPSWHGNLIMHSNDTRTKFRDRSAHEESIAKECVRCLGLHPSVRRDGRRKKRPSLSTGRAQPSIKLISKVARRTGLFRRRVTAVFDGYIESKASWGSTKLLPELKFMLADGWRLCSAYRRWLTLSLVDPSTRRRTGNGCPVDGSTRPVPGRLNLTLKLVLARHDADAAARECIRILATEKTCYWSIPTYPAGTEVDCMDLKFGKADVLDARRQGHQRQCKGIQHIWAYRHPVQKDQPGKHHNIQHLMLADSLNQIVTRELLLPNAPCIKYITVQHSHVCKTCISAFKVGDVGKVTASLFGREKYRGNGTIKSVVTDNNRPGLLTLGRPNLENDGSTGRDICVAYDKQLANLARVLESQQLDPDLCQLRPQTSESVANCNTARSNIFLKNQQPPSCAHKGQTRKEPTIQVGDDWHTGINSWTSLKPYGAINYTADLAVRYIIQLRLVGISLDGAMTLGSSCRRITGPNSGKLTRPVLVLRLLSTVSPFPRPCPRAIDHMSKTPIEIVDAILLIALDPFLNDWALLPRCGGNLPWMLPLDISLHLSQDIRVLGRLENCVSKNTRFRRMAGFYRDFLPALRGASLRCTKLAITCDHKHTWEWIYSSLQPNLPITFHHLTVVLTDRFITTTTDIYDVSHLLPSSTTTFSLAGVPMSVFNTTSLQHLVRLHISKMPMLTYPEFSGVLNAAKRITELQLALMSCDVPDNSSFIELPCLQRLVVVFDNHSLPEPCSMLVAPLLTDLRLDSAMPQCIGFLADKCTSLLRTVLRLDLGLDARIEEADISAVYGATPRLEQIDLLHCHALVTRLIFDETARREQTSGAEPAATSTHNIRSPPRFAPACTLICLEDDEARIHSRLDLHFIRWRRDGESVERTSLTVDQTWVERSCWIPPIIGRRPHEARGVTRKITVFKRPFLSPKIHRTVRGITVFTARRRVILRDGLMPYTYYSPRPLRLLKLPTFGPAQAARVRPLHFFHAIRKSPQARELKTSVLLPHPTRIGMYDPKQQDMSPPRSNKIQALAAKGSLLAVDKSTKSIKSLYAATVSWGTYVPQSQPPSAAPSIAGNSAACPRDFDKTDVQEQKHKVISRPPRVHRPHNDAPAAPRQEWVSGVEGSCSSIPVPTVRRPKTRYLGSQHRPPLACVVNESSCFHMRARAAAETGIREDQTMQRRCERKSAWDSERNKRTYGRVEKTSSSNFFQTSETVDPRFCVDPQDYREIECSVEVGNRPTPRRHVETSTWWTRQMTNHGPCSTATAARAHGTRKLSGDIEILAELNIVPRRANARVGWLDTAWGNVREEGGNDGKREKMPQGARPDWRIVRATRRDAYGQLDPRHLPQLPMVIFEKSEWVSRGKHWMDVPKSIRDSCQNQAYPSTTRYGGDEAWEYGARQFLGVRAGNRNDCVRRRIGREGGVGCREFAGKRYGRRWAQRARVAGGCRRQYRQEADGVDVWDARMDTGAGERLPAAVGRSGGGGPCGWYAKGREWGARRARWVLDLGGVVDAVEVRAGYSGARLGGRAGWVHNFDGGMRSGDSGEGSPGPFCAHDMIKSIDAPSAQAKY
ncbi:hypothetical protein B0H17DRAFT_1138878 [Mycena rosella]|uniref:Uncharacterized protein n=1 Tax=Mycena rosella TaxID=1033263 RepID=A0AAD7D5U7_MYCRO|nr:hypothetical protein B0H17DRAFT_1138878 [Mycena rosella]